MDKKEPLKEDAAKPEHLEAGSASSKQQENAGKIAQATKQQSSQQKLDNPTVQENEIESKLAGLSDQLLRVHAEFDNYKKRTAKEKEQLAHASEAKLMLRMIPAYEEIELAQKEVGKLPEGELKKGVMLVLSKLRQSFEKEGLQEMRLEGEKFDPFRHDCALKEECDRPEGEIVKVIQNGYLLRGEVLRHAVVSISAGKTQSSCEPTDVFTHKLVKKKDEDGEAGSTKEKAE